MCSPMVALQANQFLWCGDHFEAAGGLNGIGNWDRFLTHHQRQSTDLPTHLTMDVKAGESL